MDIFLIYIIMYFNIFFLPYTILTKRYLFNVRKAVTVRRLIGKKRGLFALLIRTRSETRRCN